MSLFGGSASETVHIRAAGFGAAVDAYALDSSELWFLSMLGNQQSVRAIWARLVKGEVAYLADDQFAGGRPCWLAREARREWRLRTARLPGTGAYHGVLVPDAALYAGERQDFLLLARTEEEAPLLHYRFLNRRISLPLHSSWAGWLWERGLNAGEVAPLEALGVHAYRCTPDPAELQGALSRSLRGHRLPMPSDDLAAVA